MPAENTPRTANLFASRTTAWAITIFLVALGLRLAAARGDLVFDEVWTWHIVRTTDAAWKIPFRAIDNNHILNTLIVYAIGLDAPPFAYRLPAVLAGSIALWFGYLIARREGPAAGLIVLTLLGFSHPLIVFCTEARGYAYLACCTLVAWWALEEYVDRPRNWLIAVFATVTSLGFLAHLTFAFAHAGFGVYTLLRLLPRRGGWKKCLYLHTVPALTCILLYVGFIRELKIGGGAQNPLWSTLLATFSLAAGGPERGPGALVAAGVAALLIGVSLVMVFRCNWARGVLYLLAMFVTPGAVLLSSWNADEVVYPRYFLVPLLFAYVAVGSMLARWLPGKLAVRWAAILLLGVFMASNLLFVARLIVGGRGQYSAMMRYLAEHATGWQPTLAADHDFRNYYMVQYYYAREEPAFKSRGRFPIYVHQERFPPEGTDYFLIHTFSGDPDPPRDFPTRTGVHYVLEQVFPCDSISGWTWWLYRRQ
jgi:hypothetical protein